MIGRWKKRIHGKYSRDGDLLTVKTTWELIEWLQDEVDKLERFKEGALKLTTEASVEHVLK